MSTSLVRSLIAGSVSAVASLTLFSVTADAAPAAAHATPAHSDPCLPVLTDNGNGTFTLAYPDDCNPGVPPVGGLDPAVVIPLNPDWVPGHIATELCDVLDLANLQVFAAQTGPDNWQWRFRIDGDTKYLCNDNVVVTMTDLGTGVTQQHNFTLFDIVNANSLGSDFISSWTVPCNYTTTVLFGAGSTQLAQYLDQHKETAECLPPPIVVNTIPELPENPQIPQTPNDPKTPDNPVPGDQELPHTGSDTTTVLLGGALLVAGAGLGLMAMSMTRRRRTA